MQKLIIILTATILINCKGPQGEIGPQGPKGDTGATGATGPAGKDGTNGTNASQALIYDFNLDLSKSLIQYDFKKQLDPLDDLIITKNLTTRSRNNARGNISTFFNFLKKRKIIENNPFANITNLPTVAKRHAALSDRHAKQMKETCLQLNQHDLLLYVYFVYYCAIRSGKELRYLKIQDIQEKNIFISGERIKNSKGRYAIIPSAFEKILQQYKLRTYPPNFYVFSPEGIPGQNPISRDYIYEKHKRVLKILGLSDKNYTVYSWKHTGVIALWKVTQDIEIIRQHCGHADIATTTKYLRDLGLFTNYKQIDQFPEL